MMTAFKLLYPAAYLSVDLDCTDLVEKYDGKYFVISRSQLNIDSRFDVAQKVLGLPAREDLVRKQLYVDATTNPDFIFENYRTKEEAFFESCFALTEFLKTAKLIE